MLNILSHLRNANQNNSKIPSYNCKNGQDKKYWWQLMLERLWGKWITSELLVGMHTGTTTFDVSVVISQKIRKHSSSRSSNIILGIYPKDSQSCHQDKCSTMFIAALFVIARRWKQPKCPSTIEWIRKMCYIYIMEYSRVAKK